LPRHEFLRAGELEIRVQHLLVTEAVKAGKASADCGRDGIVPFAMPTQILFRLLLEVFDVRHRRKGIYMW
jgi:hypothetical protein